MEALYNIVEVAAKVAKPHTIQLLVREVLMADGGKCYAAMEQVLMPPGLTGSRSFDQAKAVTILLEHDREDEKTSGNESIAKTMAKVITLNERALWDVLYSVLRQSGFKMRRGRLIGLLEQKPNGTTKTETAEEESGQPDID